MAYVQFTLEHFMAYSPYFFKIDGRVFSTFPCVCLKQECIYEI